jgi:phage terminase large subunit
MRDWLDAGAMLDDDKELASELVVVEYGYAMRDGHDCIILERKEGMKKRGLASSDNADALALIFAHPIGKADQRWKYGRPAHQTTCRSGVWEV